MKFNKEELNAIVMAEECEQFDEKCIVCVLTLENGYKVSGIYVHTGDGFIDNAYGEEVARDQALYKVYELESYLEQQREYELEKKSVLNIAKDSIDKHADKYAHRDFSDELIHYYCPDCGKVYSERIYKDFRATSDKVSFGTNTWRKCECGSDAFEIDNSILPVIAKLNKIGFKTEFCCEGHSFEEAAYICFDSKVSLENIELPHMWIRDKSEMIVTELENGNPEVDKLSVIERECIRVDMYNNPDRARRIYNNDFDRYKNMYLNSLCVWVDELETMVLEKREEEKELQRRYAACQTSGGYDQAISVHNQAGVVVPPYECVTKSIEDKEDFGKGMVVTML